MSEIQRIGIVGDGQLGRMLTEAALPLGFEVTTLGTAGPNSPAAQVGAQQMEGSLTDGNAIRRLADETDVVTWEIEHIDTEALIDLEEEGYNIQPSPTSLAIIKDKLQQKRHFEAEGLPVAPFRNVRGVISLQEAKEELGDLIIKSRLGGYDGRGNLVISPEMSWRDIYDHVRSKSEHPSAVYAEKIIPFQRELAVIGVRDLVGRVATYPVVETIHENNICHMVLAPADIDPRVRNDAEELGRAANGTFEGAGVFAVEMFQDENDRVLINEVAPRVHNSGHFSIEGSETSQFENHIRAITGLEVGSTAMAAPAAVMINILGTRTIDAIPSFEAGNIAPNVYVHGYGKTSRAARKIGHITVLADSQSEAQVEAVIARAQLDV